MYDCEKSVWICVFMQYMKLWMFCIFVIFEICNSQSRSRYSEKFCIFTFYSFVMTLKMSVYSELLKKVLYSLCNFRWRVFQDPLIKIFFNYHHEKDAAIMLRQWFSNCVPRHLGVPSEIQRVPQIFFDKWNIWVFLSKFGWFFNYKWLNAIYNQK